MLGGPAGRSGETILVSHGELLRRVMAQGVMGLHAEGAIGVLEHTGELVAARERNWAFLAGEPPGRVWILVGGVG
jgi:hypothetical protein